MSKYKSLVILDTRDEILEQIHNCDLISFREAGINLKKINKINIDLLDEKFLFKQRKKLLKVKKEYLKKIKKIFPEIDMHSLEIFNLRNDKVDLYNRIFYINMVGK